MLHSLERVCKIAIVEVEQAIEHPVLRVKEVVIGVASIAYAGDHAIGAGVETVIRWGRGQPAVGVYQPLSDILLRGDQCAIQMGG